MSCQMSDPEVVVHGANTTYSSLDARTLSAALQAKVHAVGTAEHTDVGVPACAVRLTGTLPTYLVFPRHDRQGTASDGAKMCVRTSGLYS